MTLPGTAENVLPSARVMFARRRPKGRSVLPVLAALATVLAGCGNKRLEPIASTSQALTLPAGFVDATVGTGWNQATGLTFATDGRLFVWEKSGKVWTVENGVKSGTPLIDLSDEVGNWRDFGLLGFAPHPDFYNNGYLYLLYVVDYYHLKNFGTPSYSPVPANQDQLHDTIGRLVRYTARSSDGFHSVDLSSRQVLVGESITTGFPILHQSHGVGSIVFGTDGTLLVSCGDGASYSETDTGGTIGGSSNTGLADGIIDQEQDVGAYRSQLVDSLSGKVIRIDPFTGDGVPGNPFFDATALRAPRSRLWALGLRNPYRMTLRPNTGSHRTVDANPGVLYIGDVGWNTWEELNVSKVPGTNFGWPAYEGLQAQPSYTTKATANLGAPNPLFGTTPSGQPVCAQQYFDFQHLLVQETENARSFPNPCDPGQQIAGGIHTFMHTRPVLDWHHGAAPLARTGIFTGGVAQVIGVGAVGSPVSGSAFGGNCSTGGVWYTATDFPTAYQNTYFHGEYGQKWVKNFVFDANDRPVAVRDFVPDGSASVVALATHPVNGGLYFIDYGSTLHQISYVGGGNRPPIAKAVADVGYGASPLTVQFTGSGSSDPEMGPLTYDWNFGDGSPHSPLADPMHVFTGATAQAFTVTLTVTDVSAASASATLVISINNTPPLVSITSPSDGSRYGMLAPTLVNLAAMVTDAEQGPDQRTCVWQTILHHNNHTHPEPQVSSCAASSTITPVGCDGNTYFYEFQLTVTDAGGLSTVKSVSMYPDCLCYPRNASPVSCNAPPDACHQATGTCANGQCNYAPVACNQPPDACHEGMGACAAGLCAYAPILCNQAPDTCHEAVGTCNGGQCSYAPVVCNVPPDACHGSTGTCSNGQCAYAPVTCNTAPDACHLAVGQCGNGVCAYPPVVCDSPPDACHQSTGSCTAGQCNYEPLTGVSCQGGICRDGVCVPTTEAGVPDAGADAADGGGVGGDRSTSPDGADGVSGESKPDSATLVSDANPEAAPPEAAANTADANAREAEALADARDAAVLDAKVDARPGDAAAEATTDGGSSGDIGCGCRVGERTETGKYVPFGLGLAILLRPRRRRRASV